MRNIVLAMLFTGCTHADCGENYAAAYAKTLEPNMVCDDIRQSISSDYAICYRFEIPSERWLCRGDNLSDGQCFPLSSKPVKFMRAVQSTEEVTQ